MSIIINGGGSGGGVATKVATTTAATVQCYSGLKSVNTTPTNIKDWIPQNAVINDVLLQSDKGNGTDIQVASTNNGIGPHIEPGGTFSSTQSYDLFVKAMASMASLNVMITYTI